MGRAHHTAILYQNYIFKNYSNNTLINDSSKKTSMDDI